MDGGVMLRRMLWCLCQQWAGSFGVRGAPLTASFPLLCLARLAGYDLEPPGFGRLLPHTLQTELMQAGGPSDEQIPRNVPTLSLLAPPWLAATGGWGVLLDADEVQSSSPASPEHLQALASPPVLHPPPRQQPWSGWVTFLCEGLSPFTPEMGAGKTASQPWAWGWQRLQGTCGHGTGTVCDAWGHRSPSRWRGWWRGGQEWEWVERCRTRRRNWVLCQCSPAASSNHPLPLDSSGANLQDGL